MVGLMEAICVLGHPADGVDVLSIGTTSVPFDVSRARRKGGILQWNKGLVDLLMQAQSEAALGQARLWTQGRLMRIDVVTRPDRFSLDNSKEIDDLKSLGEQAARQHEHEISRRFLTVPAPEFRPCYGLIATMECAPSSAQQKSERAEAAC
jgi:hypothetical protein